jgi:hypothetical protein
MSEPNWPVFKTHDNVICYHCKKPCSSDRRGAGSGKFAPGSGKYNRICKHCGTITWYDILEEVT